MVKIDVNTPKKSKKGKKKQKKTSVEVVATSVEVEASINMEVEQVPDSIQEVAVPGSSKEGKKKRKNVRYEPSSPDNSSDEEEDLPRRTKKGKKKQLKAKVQRKQVFLDIAVGEEDPGRVIIELFDNKVPKTCENFRAMCTGEREAGKSGFQLHYKGCEFHRIVPNFMMQSGNLTLAQPNVKVKPGYEEGETIYGAEFKHENYKMKHLGPGSVSMANSRKGFNSSQFFITTKNERSKWLDGEYVCFGRVITGMNVVRAAEQCGTEEGEPTKTVKIVNCGRIKKKAAKELQKSKTPAGDILREVCMNGDCGGLIKYIRKDVKKGVLVFRCYMCCKKELKPIENDEESDDDDEVEPVVKASKSISKKNGKAKSSKKTKEKLTRKERRKAMQQSADAFKGKKRKAPSEEELEARKAAKQAKKAAQALKRKERESEKVEKIGDEIVSIAGVKKSKKKVEKKKSKKTKEAKIEAKVEVDGGDTLSKTKKDKKKKKKSKKVKNSE